MAELHLSLIQLPYAALHARGWGKGTSITFKKLVTLELLGMESLTVMEILSGEKLMQLSMMPQK